MRSYKADAEHGGVSKISSVGRISELSYYMCMQRDP